MKKLRTAIPTREPPYISAGFSYGDLLMRQYASLYPEEAAGLVLVDSVHENRYAADADSGRKRDMRRTRALYRTGYWMTPLGIPQLLRRHVGSRRLPGELQAVVAAWGRRSGAYRAGYLEWLGAPVTAPQVRQGKRLRADLPVTVPTAGRQDRRWLDPQNELLKLTDRTEQMIVEDSWPSIPISKPEAVAEAVREMIIRGSRGNR
ncbi:alpha/beta hydrolase [Paenibacillus thermoaerophilus]|uniref:Alpha/beta hydrolase n=1 Tax=Paenibacillus thermoaerophilus TaxID=1215385 RepID=A0ABW2V7B3_9BACL|nr:alpha/beta hydrolase [Paenibacillus thermoaerophilus]TMV17886.1 alpha/beta hydrolase [Paenibacillus thermoaerophilus]